jgi:hypothetical protein
MRSQRRRMETVSAGSSSVRPARAAVRRQRSGCAQKEGGGALTVVFLLGSAEHAAIIAR